MKGNNVDTQIAKLTQQIEAEHTRFKTAVFAAVEVVLQSYGMTLADLSTVPVYMTIAKKVKIAGLDLAPDVAREVKASKAKKAKKPAQAKGTRPPKYRNPETGQTWSGMGHTPQWMVAAKNRDAYLIN
jgi:DNA-binding protein H-NS